MLYVLFTSIINLFTVLIFFLLKKIFSPLKSIFNYKNLAIIAFFSILFLGLIGTFLNVKTISQAENRTLAKWEPIKITGFINAPEKIEAYINDHFGMRDKFLSFYNLIQYKVFKISLTNRVIIGKKGWFFSRKSIQYTHLAKPWDEKYFIQSGMINKIELLNNKLKDKGIKLYILILPSKDYIYDEYLPKWITYNDERRKTINSFVNIIKKNTDIGILDLHDYLKASKDSCHDILYFKSDTHWNQNGAYFAAKEIFRFLNNSNETVIQNNLDSFSIKTYEHHGDLYRNGNIPFLESGNGYSPTINHKLRKINLSEQTRKALQLSDQIPNWKKIKVCYSNLFSHEQQKTVPIIIGDSFMLASKGDIIKNMFSKYYTLHYEEIEHGLSPIINETIDADMLILSFVDYKFNDEMYNSFYNCFMKWNPEYHIHNFEWEEKLPY